MAKSRLHRVVSAFFVILFVTAVYLYTFPAPNLVYPVFVLLHAFLGVAATILLVLLLLRHLREMPGLSKAAWLLLLAGGVLGCALLKIGTLRPGQKWLYAHILVSLLGLALLWAEGARLRGLLTKLPGGTLARSAAAILVLAGLSAAAWYIRDYRWYTGKFSRITNPSLPPDSMDGEGDGPQGPFFPSSVQTLDGKKIPARFFMESQACERCHQDIYKQWYGSAHHFSSFNNQWYRKSIEYMQDTVGVKPSKWCAGCHDPALLFSGKFDQPIKDQVHTAEAQAGLGCVMCHSIREVKSSMGNGDFVLEYPKLHDLAATENPVLRYLHDFVIKLNPEPHRRVFLKPFMRKQPAEFCASCHKVHLDVPVNHYRWIRGFNEYDNWQASGVSGQGARSFYYPPKSQHCSDCHMPTSDSTNLGNTGTIHSHAFPGANTAIPIANQDAQQMDRSVQFLKTAVTLDIFAVSPAAPRQESAGGFETEMATTFAVGEEQESKIRAAGLEARPISAPLNRVRPALSRGEDSLVDVVVRTRKVGHFFPGGTVDAFDVWAELKATDDTGRVLFWSGMVQDDGKGPVEPGAHFYRSLQIDGRGNPINKRNAWSTRSVVYVRLIPPGAADTIHYRLRVPENAGQKITLRARMCYRKFSWWNTQFSFAGIPDTSQPANSEVTPHYDDRRFVFTASTAEVSGNLKHIPDLPVIELAKDEITLDVAPRGAKPQPPRVELIKDDWTRWNDYGIGLLLQGDLKGAQATFQRIVDMDANNVDGWVNLGRVAVQEGDLERAREVLDRALKLQPNLARANFFYARVLRNDGKYDEAAQHLRIAAAQYPRDRVVLNDLGRIFFLQRKYADAVKVLEGVLAIDPEDLQAHYNLMLSYQGLGNEKLAAEHQKRYLRFKADESAQAVTGNYRRLHPEDNNERQAIHEHVSVAPKVLASVNGEAPKRVLARRRNQTRPTLAAASDRVRTGGND